MRIFLSYRREDAAAWARARGAGTVAITLGADGCYAEDDEFAGRVAAPRVDAVDATGAGDAFAAGMIYARLQGWSLERASVFANRVGAAATTAVGAAEGLPRIEEVLA